MIGATLTFAGMTLPLAAGLDPPAGVGELLGDFDPGPVLSRMPHDEAPRPRSDASVAACSGGNGGDDGPSYATQHPRVYIAANKDRLTAAIAAGSPTSKRFLDIVDRWVGGEDVYNFFPWNAALAGQLTGDPKYCTAAVAAVDALVVADEALIAAGTKPMIAGDDYLVIGDQIGSLALVYDWCYDAVGDRRTAWLEYANQAVSNVWNPTTASWGGMPMAWTGWAIDDPEDNYYYSFLRATMLLGLAAHGEYDGIDAWIPEFHDTKLMGELVPMFNSDLVGGGSREGTGYGVAMSTLFELYQLWNASTGEDIASMTPHTRASMPDFIHQVLPTLDRIVPTGDQSRDSTASFFDYHRNYLQQEVALFPDDPIAPRVEALLAASSVPAMTEPFMYAYDFIHDSTVAPTTLDGLGTAYYAAGAGQIYARSGWDQHATWINMNAGPYTESHAHQDQGALMIYKDGWLAYDPVVDSHSGLPQDVTDHGSLRVGTLMQKTGTTSQVLAVHQGAGYFHAAADFAPAYAASAVSKLQREVVYLEPDCVVIYDRATTTDQQVWSLAFPQQPTINGTETTMTASGHTLTIQRVSPASGPTASVYDYTADSDFSGGYRLDETLAAGDTRWLHVAYIDGAVTSIATVDANTVDVTLSGGTVAHVAFNPDSVGGTLTLGGTAITLDATIDTLAE